MSKLDDFISFLIGLVMFILSVYGVVRLTQYIMTLIFGAI
jgi:hypothetical protein